MKEIGEKKSKKKKKEEEKKWRKKRGALYIPNMQMCWFMLNSRVCITLVDAGL